MALQKLFCSFPDGRPGFGLLLLRGLLSFTLVAQTLGYITATTVSLFTVSIAVFSFVTAGCLLLGFLTPIVSVVIAVGAISFALFGLVLPLQYFSDTMESFFVLVIATVIFLLGPGAFSIDAKIFGRREIRIPAIPK